MSSATQTPGLEKPADLGPIWVMSISALATLAVSFGLIFGFKAAFPRLDPSDVKPVVDGGALFAKTCAACHGQKGEGVPGLGKDMTTSAFVQGLDDAGLIAFIRVGRTADDPANTTKVPMPAMGGNPNLTDDELNAVVEHIRSLK